MTEPVEPEKAATGRLAALREREFRLLFLAMSASFFGDQLVPLALSFAVLEIDGSVQALALVLGAAWVPTVGFLLFGGVLADRFPRRRVMIAADLARFASQGTAALLLLTGTAEIWHLIVVQVVRGAAASVFDPAITGLIPETVSSERLQQANALRVVARSAAMLAGPATAGLIVTAAGPGWALGVDAVTFAVSAALLALMRAAALREGAPVGGIFAQLLEGWREFSSRTWLWVMVVQSLVFHMLVVAPVFTLGVIIAARELGGAGAWSAILVAFGAGSLAGGAIAMHIRPRRPLVTAMLAMTGVAPHVALLAASAPAVAVIATAPLGGIALALFATLWDTTLQREVPAHVLSRVSAYEWLGSIAGFPLGYAIVGPLALVFGVHGALWLSVAVLLAATMVVVAMPSVRSVRGLLAPA
jgi:predicted MFS family arabinose efflux permease